MPMNVSYQGWYGLVHRHMDYFPYSNNAKHWWQACVGDMAQMIAELLAAIKPLTRATPIVLPGR